MLNVLGEKFEAILVWQVRGNEYDYIKVGCHLVGKLSFEASMQGSPLTRPHRSLHMFTILGEPYLEPVQPRLPCRCSDTNFLVMCAMPLQK